MKRIVAIMADLAGAVLLAAGIMMKVKSQREVSVIGETMVIGGADGPTSIFIAARRGGRAHFNLYCCQDKP